MALPPSNAITVLIIDEHAAAAARTAAALAERLPGVRLVTSASRSAMRPTGEPDLIIWNLADDSPERIGALGLFLQAGPDAPTVVIVPDYAPGLVSVAIQAGAEDAVVRTTGSIEQLAAVVMKHAVLMGSPTRRRGGSDHPRGSDGQTAGRSATPRQDRRPPAGPRGPGGLPLSDWRRVRDAVAELQRENRSLRAMVSHLRNAANTDALTGLGNARHLDSRLEELFDAWKRYGGDLSCVMLDLDGLKAVNDALGHSAGDELLRITADVIRRCTRRSDVAARAGGDEFVILLPQTAPEMAALLAARLQRELNERTACLAERLHAARAPLRLAGSNEDQRCSAALGASIGIASAAAAQPQSASDLMNAADRMMYEAKRRGNGQIAQHDAPANHRRSAA